MKSLIVLALLILFGPNRDLCGQNIEEVDIKKLKRAAERGNADAQALLGALYAQGQSVPQDYGEAVKWGHKAAEQGSVTAQLLLALIYAEGKGVPQDHSEALKWADLACAKPVAEIQAHCANIRDLLASKMTPAQAAEAKGPGGPTEAPAQRPAEIVPDVLFEVGVQQKSQEGELAPGIHLLRFHCLQQQCSLVSVTANQCIDGPNGVFALKMEGASTSEGNLRVRRVGSALEVEEARSSSTGEGFARYRFQFEPNGTPITKLVSFSGGYVKSSSVASKIVTSEYVALPQSLNLVKLDCSLAVIKGIDGK